MTTQTIIIFFMLTFTGFVLTGFIYYKRKQKMADIPRLENGSIDTSQVTAATIIYDENGLLCIVFIVNGVGKVCSYSETLYQELINIKLPLNIEHLPRIINSPKP